MTKRPTLTDVDNVLTSKTTLNNNNALIEAHFDNFLSRDGSTPNQMEADFDLNSNDVLNGGVGNFSDIFISGVDLTSAIVASQTAAEAAALAAELALEGVLAAVTGVSSALYLGSKSVEPILNNEDEPLVDGNLYYNTVSSDFFIYESGSWIAYDVQISDAELDAIAGLTSAANKVPYFTGLGTADMLDLQTTLTNSDTSVPTSGAVVDYGAATFQPLDAELTAIAGLTSAANKVPYFTGSGTASMLDLQTTISDSDTSTPTSGAVVDYVAANGGTFDAQGLFEIRTDGNIGNGVQYLFMDQSSWSTNNGGALVADANTFHFATTGEVRAEFEATAAMQFYIESGIGFDSWYGLQEGATTHWSFGFDASDSATLKFVTGFGIDAKVGPLEITKTGEVSLGQNTTDLVLAGKGSTTEDQKLQVYNNDSLWASLLVENEHVDGKGILVRATNGTSGAGKYMQEWRTFADVRKAAVFPDGRMAAGDGSVGSPGLTFVDDQNTGFYRPGADNIGIATLGAEHIRIGATGTMFFGSAITGTTEGVLPGNGNTTAGVAIRKDGLICASQSSANAMRVNRSTTTGKAALYCYNGTEVGDISVTGSTTTFNSTSDERAKENIVDAGDAGDVIDAIQVRSFDFKSDGAHWDFGVIAQELEPLFPHAVTRGDTEDDMWSVDPAKMVPMLIKEIQDLRKRVSELESKV